LGWGSGDERLFDTGHVGYQCIGLQGSQRLEVGRQWAGENHQIRALDRPTYGVGGLDGTPFHGNRYRLGGGIPAPGCPSLFVKGEAHGSPDQAGPDDRCL
jgi:hypothetical protein